MAFDKEFHLEAVMALENYRNSRVNLLPRTQELRDQLAHALHETEVLRRLLKVAEYSEQHFHAVKHETREVDRASR